MANSKTLTPEEAEAKYERIVISSLQGYTLYLEKVNLDGIEKAKELNEKLITDAKFWKFAKHKTAQIRAAWFGLLTALCMKAPFLLENNPSRVVPAVLSNLDETEPTVLPRVWEAVLLTITTIKVSKLSN